MAKRIGDILYEKVYGLNTLGEEVRGIVYVVNGKAEANQAFYNQDGEFLEISEIPLGRFNSVQEAIEYVDNFSIEI